MNTEETYSIPGAIVAGSLLGCALLLIGAGVISYARHMDHLAEVKVKNELQMTVEFRGQKEALQRIATWMEKHK